jgi:phage replication-related protein YjqB (UPF0714/DUF867 family)
VPEPHNYEEILARKLMPGRDLRVEFGDSKIDQCLLIAPHGGGIEPGTSEIMRAVASLGGWAWYDFAGFLRQGNKEQLHIASTRFNEPTLMALLPQTKFVVAFHGADEMGSPLACIGGKWKRGRETLIYAINAASKEHGLRAVDVTEGSLAYHLRGLDDDNLTNRGKSGEGVQIEFSREARNLLFPPNASRESRGRRSAHLRPLAKCLHQAIQRLCQV